MFKKLFLSLACVAALTNSALSWGGKGHDIVAQIATRHLTPEAKKEITKILEGRTMVYYSSWMDEIRSQEEYKFTSPWHYVNIGKDDAKYSESTSKNPSGDVYTAVEESVKMLKNMDKLEESKKAFYLKALIHFVGDMHCPMHSGYNTDMGGNKFRLEWFGEPTSLHGLWDSAIIESAHKWSYSEWAENIDCDDYKDNVAKYCDSDIIDWMDETSVAAKLVYSRTTEDGSHSWDYLNENKPLLEEQLLKGGIRLAYLLNSLF